MAAFTGDLEPTPRYLEDPNFRIEVGKYYQLVNLDLIYIKKKIRHWTRRDTFEDHLGRVYSNSGFSLEYGQGFSKSIYRKATKEEFTNRSSSSSSRQEGDSVVRCSKTDSQIDERNMVNKQKIKVKVGYAYRSVRGTIVEITGSRDGHYIDSSGSMLFDHSGMLLDPPARSVKLSEEIGPILKQGGIYRNRNGNMVFLLDPDVVVFDSDFYYDTENLVYDKYGRINTPYKDKSENDLISIVDFKKGDSEVTDTQPLNLKVGYVYRQESGGLSLIVDILPNIESIDVLVDHNGVNYFQDGRVWTGRTPELRLIEEVGSIGSEASELLFPRPGTADERNGDLVKDLGRDANFGEVEEVDTTITGFDPKFPIAEQKTFLSSTDIENLANYVSKIEQLVNAVGLKVDIRLSKLEEGG